MNNVTKIKAEEQERSVASGKTDGYHFEVREVPLGQLHIDHKYQRNMKESKIKEMDKEGHGFDPIRAGSLTTIRRINGEIFIIDGQHRYHLARQCGRSAVLCLIWFSSSAKPINEPQAFVNMNTLRKALSRSDKFKALLEANDPRTWKIAEILHKHGLTATPALNLKGANLFNAIGTAELIFDIGGEAHFDMVLTVLLKAFPEDDRCLKNFPLLGMHVFLNAYQEEMKSKQLEIKELIEKLSKYTIRKLEQKAAANIDARGGDIRSNFARAILDIYNTGRRNKRLQNRFD